MKILVRLPNWLGDVIMSMAFLGELKKVYPESEIDVIIKKELSDLILHSPEINHTYPFSKKEYPGIKGLYSFGKFIKARKKYDLFFCLPESFSSALLGYFMGSKIRIGYKKEFRNLFLTNAYTRESGRHRAEDYIGLLTKFSGIQPVNPSIQLSANVADLKLLPQGKNLIFNINSEAQSRKMPVELAAELIAEIKKKYNFNIILTGSNKDVEYVAELVNKLSGNALVYNYAGKTTLKELIGLVSQADITISTDSGIAHLSNAFLINTIVLFGAGNETSTAPYNKNNVKIIRKKGLDCAPCLSNTCKFGTPKCLTTLDRNLILKALEEFSV
ncbi:MAG TPA: lipopolysaccharide heptosyltransferase II [Cytophagaceae bacterium]|jgi:heptosyltransferase-2|nr:lipopolysaccharide heptosyltransferase II [Cytophagaceae bacterium]